MGCGQRHDEGVVKSAKLRSEKCDGLNRNNKISKLHINMEISRGTGTCLWKNSI